MILTIFPEELHFATGFLLNGHFCNGHWLVYVSIFCVPCELETPNREGFFHIIHLSTSYADKCDNILEATFEIYYGIVCRHGTSLTCDFLVSSFPLPLHHLWINSVRMLSSTSVREKLETLFLYVKLHSRLLCWLLTHTKRTWIGVLVKVTW